ncbi:two-component regulator propeller domain-containing protein [Marivirga arenosa]|uniref:Two-component regulator propeller domain-containing protein n=1 Tax=Marivirga arenosa TaxID=3059076 RepID=A0AA52EZQ6_9BACT|nr:two-component regulator propeller domain-containing protein [Marivirga sp. BKB1-2]WNB18711.1 two-component regulator propeller domain-containing protein [Marivirga sp. BKB1-2]
MRVLYLLIVQFLAIPVIAQTQLGNTDFNHLNVNDGLAQNIVEAIYQGSEGFLWLGTQNGLNRYDGYNFVSYEYVLDDSSSISNNYIKDIVEDKKGNLWIGTYGGGLNKFDKNSIFKHYINDPNNPYSISDNVVYQIYKQSDSIYWLGTKNGLNRFHLPSEKFEHKGSPKSKIPQLNNPVVYCISKAASINEIWVGTRNGLHKINLDTFSSKLYLKGDNGLLDDDIRDLFLDSKNTLWVATKLGGLHYKEANSDRFVKIDLIKDSNRNVYSRKIYAADNQGIWLGTFGDGLFLIDNNRKVKYQFKENQFNPKSISSNDIVEIFKDESSNYWIGTHGGGVSSFNLNSKKFDLYQADAKDPNSLSSNAVNYIYEDTRGNIYVANDAGIDLVIEKEDGLEFKQIIKSDSKFPDDRAWLLHEDSDNILWVGMWNYGLSRYDRDTGKLISYTHVEGDSTSIPTNFIETISESDDGKLWIGLLGDGGLAIFDKETKKFKSYLHDLNDPNSLSNNRVHKILIDSKNRIWLGTDYGLDLYRPKTDDFKHFRYDRNNPYSINYNVIRTISEDRNDNIWIGTGGGGIAKLIENGDSIYFKTYTEEDGLVDNNISGITEDLNGNLWITTYSGISLFDTKSESFVNYTSSDGLQGEEFVRSSITTLEDGRIFAGGFNGLNVFKPDEIKRSNYSPEINVISIGIISEEGERTINDFNTDTVFLKYSDYILSFEVASTDLSNQGDKKYAYKLEGFNKDWIMNNERRHFSFTNLPPGEYNLKIKGSNGDGIWSSNIKELYIKVDPPFWATNWFRIVAIVGLGFLIFIYIQLRVKYLKAAQIRLQSKVEERTSELELANRKLLENQNLVIKQKEEITKQNEEIASKNAIIQKQNDELKLNNIQLEEVVSERTHELREANDDLKIAKHEFDTFFYRAAHDLKGPVSTILGLCYLALKEEDKVIAHSYFEKINITAERMNNILFNLQKINKLKQEGLKIKNHNLRQLIISAAKENLPDNEDWQQFIDIELKAQDEDILTDMMHLKIVFSNLIDNSIKFSKRGEKPNVLIQFEKDEKNHSYQIIFEDFGLGINPDIRDRIFNMFFVATEYKRGLGLGLYSVRLAVSKLGGSIQLDKNKSACFRIDIPMPEIPKEKIS